MVGASGPAPVCSNLTLSCSPQLLCTTHPVSGPAHLHVIVARGNVYRHSICGFFRLLARIFVFGLRICIHFQHSGFHSGAAVYHG